jgi:hypothetical protein
VTKLQITSGWLAAGIMGSVLCGVALPATGNAAVSEDAFLVRTTGDLVELCEATSADTLYTAAINFCHGFSSGVYRVLEEENMATARHMFCMPDRRLTATRPLPPLSNGSTRIRTRRPNPPPTVLPAT